MTNSVWPPKGRVLVTGGTGAIGAWVCGELVREGVRPVALDQRLDVALLGKYKDDVDLAVGDITDWAFLVRILINYQVDTIIHLAAVMPPGCQANPFLGFRVNTGGTMNIYEAARATGVRRVIYASTRSVFGHIDQPHGHPDYQPLPEDYPKSPRNVYGATKLACENMAYNYRTTYNMDFVGVRFPAMFGPGRLARHGNIARTSLLVETGLAGEDFVFESGGDQRDDLMYTKDGARGLVALVKAPVLKYPVYHIGTKTAVSPKDLAGAVMSMNPKAKIQVGPGLDYAQLGYQEYSVLDNSRIEEETGFTCKYDLKAAVADYAATLDELGMKPLGG